ncbi:MAG: polysaccharide biosynthesis/export family protein [Gammaproteobacteria bacterium]|nr:polysaccharide biosynthesis/export family protein [Gammaproteobacteria bacterium]MCH9715635.1 polysaccharide biosynthesis/export family protein [Gammaproteobacteria bacterium]MCH9763964.1 polysaccharide biosynthesis/export family protein [Gammaproteobacteria bacterium]
MAQEVVDLNKLKKLGITASALALSACNGPGITVLPGMQNMSTYKMRKYVKQERIHVQPTLIPITPALIQDQQINTYFYRVALSDVINVDVWKHPEFSYGSQSVLMGGKSGGAESAAGGSGYLVDPNGRIYFPLVGYLHVAGKTVDEIRVLITKRLERYIPHPEVNVRVSDFRGQKIYVLGEVGKKGFLPITDQQMTIADALALSDWFDPKYADTSHIYVIRGDYTHPEIFWLNAKTPDKILLAEHFSLQPKDVLYVSVAPIPQMNRILDQLLPIVQTVWFTQSVIKQSSNNI